MSKLPKASFEKEGGRPRVWSLPIGSCQGLDLGFKTSSRELLIAVIAWSNPALPSETIPCPDQANKSGPLGKAVFASYHRGKRLIEVGVM